VNKYLKNVTALFLVMILALSLGLTGLAESDYKPAVFNAYDDALDFAGIEPLSSASFMISPGGQDIEVWNGGLYVNGARAHDVDMTLSWREATGPSSFRTITHRLTAMPENFEVLGLIGVGALRNQNALFNNVALVWVTGIRVSGSIPTQYLDGGTAIQMFYDITNGRWVDTTDPGITFPERPSFTQVIVTPRLTNVQRGTTMQFNASVQSHTGGLVGGRTWSILGNNSSGTTISSAGLVTVAANETARSILVIATSTQAHLSHSSFPNTIGVAYVSISGSATNTVTTVAQLEQAILSAPANIPTTIQVMGNMSISNPITVPTNRQITLVSNNTSTGAANMRTLSQMTAGQRHFIVQGALTLGQNITLSGGLAGATHFSAYSIDNGLEIAELDLFNDFISQSSTHSRNADSSIAEFSEFQQTLPFGAAVQSGGVIVAPGGTLTVNAGSFIQDSFNNFGGAVQLIGSGVDASTRATLNINGGTIRNNIAHYGGAVDAYTNSRINMTSGTISSNQVFRDGGALWIGSGSTAGGQGFNMTGGNITNNFATIDGGGIFTTDFASGYGNLFIGASTIFSGNVARGWVSPPPLANRPAHISSATASIGGYVLNNLDIIYWGHLG